MGIPISEQPVEFASIHAMLQAESYEEVHAHISKLMKQELVNFELEEQQAKFEDIDAMETFVTSESDPMETVLEMNDLVNSQAEAEHVLIDVYN